ncbi:hypothetical protein TBLA_0G03240 [Henningerozyma blattae CBS 6284]|uniref:C2H2-type domain-containing protein n=1 Tax=Henningerozyma blattae (strain ATCC 34711 / CBS 6284 / DSM 70876 / NBRC 10599 / NRRL Y-10934 / UCD 77-7) TaxID=1071380 RepID=I2H7A9_HENB6|nr:hypothetical protein TBLA_0G03240 [Tetrapisispora blattae CBS 6284]CCH62261.1 hypothetical protein TBLA_0G03240 [Tetrapisispora blattae CBS 6284]
MSYLDLIDINQFQAQNYPNLKEPSGLISDTNNKIVSSSNISSNNNSNSDLLADTNATTPLTENYFASFNYSSTNNTNSSYSLYNKSFFNSSLNSIPVTGSQSGTCLNGYTNIYNSNKFNETSNVANGSSPRYNHIKKVTPIVPPIKTNPTSAANPATDSTTTVNQESYASEKEVMSRYIPIIKPSTPFEVSLQTTVGQSQADSKVNKNTQPENNSNKPMVSSTSAINLDLDLEDLLTIIDEKETKDFSNDELPTKSFEKSVNFKSEKYSTIDNTEFDSSVISNNNNFKSGKISPLPPIIPTADSNSNYTTLPTPKGRKLPPLKFNNVRNFKLSNGSTLNLNSKKHSHLLHPSTRNPAHNNMILFDKIYSSSSPPPLKLSCMNSESKHHLHSQTIPNTSLYSASNCMYPNPKNFKYHCDICHKFFRRPSSLKTHMNIHTGVKPYLCPYNNCYKPFNAKSNMLRHFKLHYRLPNGIYVLPNGIVTWKTPTTKQMFAKPQPNLVNNCNIYTNCH